MWRLKEDVVTVGGGNVISLSNLICMSVICRPAQTSISAAYRQTRWDRRHGTLEQLQFANHASSLAERGSQDPRNPNEGRSSRYWYE
jgi:hypothetical protein